MYYILFMYYSNVLHCIIDRQDWYLNIYIKCVNNTIMFMTLALSTRYNNPFIQFFLIHVGSRLYLNVAQLQINCHMLTPSLFLLIAIDFAFFLHVQFTTNFHLFLANRDSCSFHVLLFLRSNRSQRVGVSGTTSRRHPGRLQTLYRR